MSDNPLPTMPTEPSCRQPAFKPRPRPTKIAIS